MTNCSSSHYNAKYFSWQSSTGGEFGGWANLCIFDQYINPEFNVIDFGCGGGYLLSNIVCRGKLGIEVNTSAREHARSLGINAVESSSEVEDKWADLIISNHALEHCPHPLLNLKELHQKLRPGGRIVFIVPCESIRFSFRSNDVNRHLYSWSPMSLGNLFTEAGFVVEECKPFYYKWPPFYRIILRIGGQRVFKLCCHIYGLFAGRWHQVRIVSKRKQE